MKEMINAYKILVRTSEGKSNWEDLDVDGKIFRMNLREIGWEVVD
jgi:hypothetical protein